MTDTPTYLRPPHEGVSYLVTQQIPTVVRLAQDVAPDGMPAIFDETFTALVPALAETEGVVVFHEQMLQIIAETTGVDAVELDERALKDIGLLRSDLDGALAHADPILLQRVLVNLLANAHRYTPAGTPIHVSTSTFGDRLEIRIIDRGPGIPPEKLDDIFLPFQRLGDTDNTSGLGLGLAGGDLRAAGQGPRIHGIGRQGHAADGDRWSRGLRGLRTGARQCPARREAPRVPHGQLASVAVDDGRARHSRRRPRLRRRAHRRVLHARCRGR